MPGRPKEAMQALKLTVGCVGGGAGVLRQAAVQMAVMQEKEDETTILGPL